MELLTNPNDTDHLWMLVNKKSGPMVLPHGNGAYLCCFDNTEQAESAAFWAENAREPVRYEIAKADVQRVAAIAQDSGLLGLAIRCPDGEWKLWNTGGRREMRSARRSRR